jgi:hypothetical protein
MLRKFIVLFICSYIVILFSGCATVIHGTTQKITISTDPPGATITVDTNLTTYSTPTTIKLRRKVNHDILISKPDFEPEQLHIYHIFSMAIAGNLILGGMTGIVTDSVNGAKSRLIPKSINLILKPLGTGPGLPLGISVEDRIKQLDVLREQQLITKSEYTSVKKRLLKPNPTKKPKRTPAEKIPE